MWVVLLWVVVMAGGIWWVTKGNSAGQRPGAGIASGPPTAPVPTAPPQAGQEWSIGLVGNITMDLVWIAPGNFTMGSPASEPSRYADEGPQMQVTLTNDFWLGKYPVTQRQWQAVMGKNPSNFTAAGLDAPVETVSWEESMAFCKKLTDADHATGRLPANYRYTLPTEAQWEYACRAGTTTATAFGDKLSSRQANFKGQPYNGAEPGPSLGRAAKVGSYPPNAWGIHDMHGNTFEWCRDWYHPKLLGGVDPDLYRAKATSRVRRGGCWADEGWPCRSAFHLRFEPERRYDHIGFRVVAVKS